MDVYGTWFYMAANCSSAKENGCHEVARANSSMKSWNPKTTQCEPRMSSWNIQHTDNTNIANSANWTAQRNYPMKGTSSYQISKVHGIHPRPMLPSSPYLACCLLHISSELSQVPAWDFKCHPTYLFPTGVANIPQYLSIKRKGVSQLQIDQNI